MKLKRLLVRNYKCFKELDLQVEEKCNIFVGQNDSGKSTLLEIISMILTGKINGTSIERQLRSNMFNIELKNEYLKSIGEGKSTKLPEIIIEGYLCGSYPEYQGTNNTLNIDESGLGIYISFNPKYHTSYLKMINSKQIYDIPIEYYKVEIKSFKGEDILYRDIPFKSVIVDTTKKNYSGLLDKFVLENISSHVTQEEEADISASYKTYKNQFRNDAAFKKIYEKIGENIIIADNKIELDLRENEVDEWKKNISVKLNDIPYEYLGFGTQNIIKIDLAIKKNDLCDIILMEEPENNLSYTNMVKLIARIQETNDKQIFITTHSSYVINKLGLDSIFLVDKGNVGKISNISDETKSYFQKIPGYDTLRLVLAEKVILVEGPTDDLIIQRAYMDENGCLPICNGVDIIVVDSLAFKRYCEIANLINKKIVIVTDNDGDIEKNINTKYEKFINCDNIKIIYEQDERLKTIEPSVLHVNFADEEKAKLFKKVLSKNNSMMSKTENEILEFMHDNKTEWAIRVFESKDKIEYPEYIKNVVKEFN